MTSNTKCNPSQVVCTCFCPSCEIFVGVNPKGQCENCWIRICFLQDENNNFEILQQEIPQ